MLNVLIIDDDLKDSKDLEKLCIHYFNKRNIDYKINIELKLNENLDTFSNVDILFLDVEIGNNSGIEFSKRLRKVYPELIIIITSKYSQYLIDGYSIDAKRYFLKPIDENIFNEEMENVLGATFQKYMGFYDSKIAPYKIHYDKILYVEFLNRATVLHFLNGVQIKTSYPLKYWIEKLTEYGFDKFVIYPASTFKMHERLAEYKAFFEPQLSDLAISRNISMGIKEISARIDLIDKEKAAVEAAIKATV